MNICQVSEWGNEAGAKETRLLDALSWKTKQERELGPHARGPAPHPAQLLLAEQAGVSLHFLHPRQRLEGTSHLQGGLPPALQLV